MDERDGPDLHVKERLAIGDYLDSRQELARQAAAVQQALASWEKDGDGAQHALLRYIDSLTALRVLLSRAVAAERKAYRRRIRERGP